MEGGSPFMSGDASYELLMGLMSGVRLIISHVVLYDETKVKAVMLLRTQAAERFGGVSSGLGFWGSPGWVLGGVAVLGALEGLATNRARKEGLQLLERAQKQWDELKAEGFLFNMRQIENIQSPYPDHWRAVSELEDRVDVSRMGMFDRKRFLQKHNLTKENIYNGVALIKRAASHIHNGDEFIIARTEEGLVNIRWSQVCTHQIFERR